jgi:quercetin dioxygenase-like cupin family protein
MQPTMLATESLSAGDPARFTGDVRLGLVAGSSDETLHLYEVLFGSRARTHWHTHSGEQVLLCTQGRCVVQIRGEAPIVLPERTAFRVAPGVVHWHGAMEDASAHLAANIAASTTWLDAVEEADYESALSSARAAR